MKPRHPVATACQWFGAACLLVVLLTHVCEAHHLLPFMGWGLRHSSGHYLDLDSALLGLTLIPVGFLIRIVVNRVRAAADD